MISRNHIIDKLHRKFGRKLQKQSISDACEVICDFLIAELVKDQAVSVENFGTLSPGVTQPHKMLDVSTGLHRTARSLRTVRFRASSHLLMLVKRRREKFLRGR